MSDDRTKTDKAWEMRQEAARFRIFNAARLVVGLLAHLTYSFFASDVLDACWRAMTVCGVRLTPLRGQCTSRVR